MPGKTKAQLLAQRKTGRSPVYDPDKIMEEMLEWSDEEDSLNFTSFCAERGYNSKLIWTFEQQYEDFSDAYELVKMKLAVRREKHLNTDQMNYGAWARYQKGYDPFLSNEEDKEKDKDAARAKGVADKERSNLLMLAKMAGEGKIKQE